MFVVDQEREREAKGELQTFELGWESINAYVDEHLQTLLEEPRARK